MEIARFKHNGQIIVGRRQNGCYYPLPGLSLAQALQNTVAEAGEPLSASDVELLPAIDPGAKILCVALNYVDHAKESNQPLPESPILFFKSQEAIIAAGAPISAPAIVTQLDYEGEIAIIIGKDAFNVSEEQAWEHIAGVAPFNDVSSRNLLNVKAGERTHLDWFSAKCLNSSTPIGPAAVSLANVRDDLQAKRTRVVTRVNGEVRQDATIADMIFDIPKIVAFASSRVQLSVGDVIATGTPPGVGFADGRFLKRGDVVEVEITGLPLLSNVVA